MTGAFRPISRPTPTNPNQGSVGRLGAGIGVPEPNPGVQPISPETGVKVESGKSPELAGQSPESAFAAAMEIIKQDFGKFVEEEQRLKQIADTAMRTIGWGNGNNPNPSIGNIQPIIDAFRKEASVLSDQYRKQMGQFLSGNSNTQNFGEPPFNFLGPNIPSNQNPQGPVLAA